MNKILVPLAGGYYEAEEMHLLENKISFVLKELTRDLEK